MARARSFGNIRKLPSGRYQARFWRLGKQVAADTTFASKTDARRWLATVEADMIRGVWVDPDADRIPFGKYAMRWVAERPVRPRTREIYEVRPPSSRSRCQQQSRGWSNSTSRLIFLTLTRATWPPPTSRQSSKSRAASAQS